MLELESNLYVLPSKVTTYGITLVNPESPS